MTNTSPVLDHFELIDVTFIIGLGSQAQHAHSIMVQLEIYLPLYKHDFSILNLARLLDRDIWFWSRVFNTTFNNISAIW